MRILHVQETLSQRFGGPTRVMEDLVKAQAAAGHDVVVVTTNEEFPRGTYREPGWDTMPDGKVPVFYGAVEFTPLLFSRSLTTYLWRNISDFDIVVVHGAYRYPLTLACFLAKRRGIPYVVMPHGSLDPYLHGKSTMGQLRMKRLYERLFAMPALQAANAIHFTAEDERERASFLNLRAPSFVVPNGLDWDPYSTLPPRGEMRRRWGLGDAPIVLFLGRLHVKKGLDLLIPAFDKVRRSEPDAQLVIAGPDNYDYGKTVRGWVTERGLDPVTHFVGVLHGPDVVQAFVDADVFSLPSYTENFGMAVAEAMACRCPVVISDQVNIHAAIAEAGAGIVTHTDIEETAAALQALLRNADRRRAMGDAGRRLVEECFVWSAIVDRLTEEYQAAIARSRR